MCLDNPVDRLIVEIRAWVEGSFLFSRWGPGLAWGASKVKREVFNGVSQDVVEGSRDRSVWEVGLNKLSALWVVVGSGFVPGRDAQEAEREGRGFHAGEIGSEGEVKRKLGVGVLYRRGRLFQASVWFRMG